MAKYRKCLTSTKAKLFAFAETWQRCVKVCKNTSKQNFIKATIA